MAFRHAPAQPTNIWVGVFMDDIANYMTNQLATVFG